MQLHTCKGVLPQVHRNVFIAKGAQVIGQVQIGSGSSIWFNAVIRADMDKVTIGDNSNVQDNAVVHVADEQPVAIGDNVTIGHGAVVHGCKVGNNVLIGMNATILDGAEIGDNCIVGANALIPQGKKIPAGSMVVGMPGKVVRKLTEEEIKGLTAHAKHYSEMWQELY